MVVREDADGWLCIPQAQHAKLSGQIARLWGNERFSTPAPRPEVVTAAARHDDGMKRFDEAPEHDPETGLPRDFMRMPLGLWLECWRRGPRLVAADDPYAGILVALHGLHLLGYRRVADDDAEGRAALGDYRREQERLVGELVERCRRDGMEDSLLRRDAIEANRELVSLWDAISLAICMPRLPDSFEAAAAGGTVELELAAVGRGRHGEVLIGVTPWPFDAAQVPVAATGDRVTTRFDSGDEMRRALASAEAEILAATLVPTSG